MKRAIRRVRHSIRRRKKKKNLSEMTPTNEFSSLYLPDQEERHGLYQPYMNSHKLYEKEKRTLNSGWIKAMMSLLLFVGLTFVLKTNYNGLKKPQEFVNYYLNEEFPFAKVNDWYVETFGDPLALLPEENGVEHVNAEPSLPVSGNVTEPFTMNGKGIMISPMENAIVSAFNRGVVIFAGNDRHTKKTVIIQHPDSSKTTYGHLSSVDVHLYQIVQADDRIGTFHPSDKNETVYFSIEQNNSFVDPVQVIQVDKNQ